MPTPRPIITPIVGANSGTVSTWLRMRVPDTPTATLTTAAPMVAPMATTEPSTTIRMKIARASPTASDSGGSRSARNDPPTSTCRPSLERSPAPSMSSLMAMPRLWACVNPMFGSRLISAKAMSPASGPCDAIRADPPGA